ncbi:DUF4179 domain-containing protein [Brevibacillus borstelensis]|uniref:DUF4179 domain-containing protein n=1 Tax=Brevibacillus borstelensis TaxID=45462 RepID=UPI00203DA597|nr:DUF4179 domain-containing protein [Brevibacillus borstelensis]MCM3473492.1 DUF4179 domain-containing protein [Brevibacillus borstelensis]
MTSSILEVFGFGHLKTSPSWGEVPFLCPKILTAHGLRLLQNAHGKKLLGFDEVITGTLQELNHQGMGQIVEKEMDLRNGTRLVINGIMADANQLVMYYTLTNPDGLDDMVTIDTFRPSRITGLFTDSFAGGGTAIISDDQTEIKGSMSFDPVSPFAKTLTLHFWQQLQDGQMVESTISFPYNPNKAMQAQFKQTINKQVEVDKGTIIFRSITASPTMTVIEGSMNVENHDRVSVPLGGIELLANGTAVPWLGSGSSSSLRGYNFDIRYDALPPHLESLELVVKEFVGYQTLEKTIALDALDDKPVMLGGKELRVKKVSVSSQEAGITIVTDEDVMLDGVSIQTKSAVIPLRTTVGQEYIKEEDGRIKKERTLLFDAAEEPQSMIIEGMHYMKPYDIKIEIPLD